MADNDSARRKQWEKIVANEAHKVCREYDDWTDCPHPWKCHEYTCCPVDCDYIGEYVDADDAVLPIDLICEDDEADPSPPKSWIVEGLVGEKRKGVIFGKAKQKKTMLALQLAECVATGRDFLGMKVPKPRKVVYLNMEIAADEMLKRVVAMGRNFALDATHKKTWQYVADGVTKVHEQDEFDYDFNLFNFRGHGEEVRKHWLSLLHEVCDADLVIIDPRYKLLLPGEDENTAQGLRGFQAFVDRLAEFSAVVTVIHDGKGTAKGEHGAGSYTTNADYDFAMAIDAAGKDEDENLKILSFPDARSFARRPSMEIRFDPVKFMFAPTSKTTGE